VNLSALSGSVIFKLSLVNLSALSGSRFKLFLSEPECPQWFGDFQLFFRTFQNELTPKYPNVKQKHAAITSRPGPVIPAAYFAHSRLKAIPPMPAIARKTNPITSCHSWCRIRPKDLAVARTAFALARPQRLRPACCAATRAPTPSFWVKVSLPTGRFYQCSGLQ
jgi:hypothetical protein